jgi:hypothetical protein
VSLAAAAPVRHVWFKAVVFVLLGWNTAVFIHSGTLSEALDAIAWLTLLVLFELETDFGERLRTRQAATAVRAARLAAAAAVCAAAIGYVREQEWLDAINGVLWIAVAALLEIQVRFRRPAVQYRAWFAAGATLLYAGLSGVVLAWLWRGEWFDAYDALLWLAALVIIEMNVLRGLRGEPRAEPARPG